MNEFEVLYIIDEKLWCLWSWTVAHGSSKLQCNGSLPNTCASLIRVKKCLLMNRREPSLHPFSLLYLINKVISINLLITNNYTHFALFWIYSSCNISKNIFFVQINVESYTHYIWKVQKLYCWIKALQIWIW